MQTHVYDIHMHVDISHMWRVSYRSWKFKVFLVKFPFYLAWHKFPQEWQLTSPFWSKLCPELEPHHHRHCFRMITKHAKIMSIKEIQSTVIIIINTNIKSVLAICENKIFHSQYEALPRSSFCNVYNLRWLKF